MQNAEPVETFNNLGRRHGGSVVAQGGARQAAFLEGLRQAVCRVLGVLCKIPLQVTGEPRAIVNHAKQNGRLPLAARRENFFGSHMTVPMQNTAHVLGFIAAHFAIKQPRLGSLGALCPTRRQASLLLDAMCLEKAAQRGIRRQWPQLGPLVAERDQIVVMELEGPTLVRRVLRQQGLAHRIAHRRLLSGVRAHLDDGVEAADAFAELARKTEKLSLEKQLERYRHDLDPISDYAPVEWI